ncbi:AAA family ATPase [Xanthomonas cucurbitae]|uniref:AAA family ATPase n=1 Tax=Xanthomonas cucurbitae TaxID=56453 RepID=UPI002012CBD4|nr:AAA family ATPase [Xanthomonas cucurbitae]
MKIESIRLRNFKAFRDVHLKDMPSFLVVVGANGSGKSTLFDVFGFLHDCLKGNVRQALDKRWTSGGVSEKFSAAGVIPPPIPS